MKVGHRGRYFSLAAISQHRGTHPNKLFGHGTKFFHHRKFVYTCISNNIHVSMPIRSPDRIRKRKPYRKNTRNACSNCQREHVRCDDLIICHPCVEKGTECTRTWKWVHVHKDRKGSSGTNPVWKPRATLEVISNRAQGSIEDSMQKPTNADCNSALSHETQARPLQIHEEFAWTQGKGHGQSRELCKPFGQIRWNEINRSSPDPIERAAYDGLSRRQNGDEMIDTPSVAVPLAEPEPTMPYMLIPTYDDFEEDTDFDCSLTNGTSPSNVSDVPSPANSEGIPLYQMPALPRTVNDRPSVPENPFINQQVDGFSQKPFNYQFFNGMGAYSGEGPYGTHGMEPLSRPWKTLDGNLNQMAESCPFILDDSELGDPYLDLGMERRQATSIELNDQLTTARGPSTGNGEVLGYGIWGEPRYLKFPLPLEDNGVVGSLFGIAQDMERYWDIWHNRNPLA